MTDMFLLLLLPGGGDELQGIKRGIMELADLVLVNKADGDLEATAGRSAAEYRSALQLLHPRSAHWKVPVRTCSARSGQGIDTAWQNVLDYRDTLQNSGEFDARRAAQARAWMWSEVNDSLVWALQGDPEVRRRIPELEAAVSEGRMPATLAARELLELFLKHHERWD
jgi:LAO/AO transport system kinase